MKKIRSLKMFKPIKAGLLTAALMLMAFAGFATNVHLHLLDHNGTPITDLSGLGNYNNGSWHTAVATDGSGDVNFAGLTPGSYYFNMKYHGYTQQVGPFTISGTDYDKTFQTTLVSLNLKDHTGTLITAENGLANYDPATTWQTPVSTSGTGSLTMELLPGAGYYFNMKYHNYTQQVGPMSVTTGGGYTQDVDFRTTLVTLNLMNHLGALITSTSDIGIGGYNATSAWYPLGGTAGTGKTSIELLSGAGYYFNMKYHNYTQQQGSLTVGNGGTWTQDINFHTTLVTLNLKCHTGSLITLEDGTGGYNATSAWYTLGSTAGTGKNCIELLPGSNYFFNMKFHNYTQQQGAMSVANGGTWMQSVDFQTTQVSLNLKDNTGALITGEDGTGGYNATSAWYTLGSTAGTGKNVIELLPGANYFFNMKFHNYTQQVGAMSVTGGGSWMQAVDFKTTLVSVNLKNCGGALIPSNDAVVRYNATSAWYPLGTTSGGTISIQLLPGSGYFFDMAYNNGKQQKGSMEVNPSGLQDVNFTTTQVNFSNPNSSAIQYNQTSWSTFTPNSMELLPGSYYFKVTGGGATISKSVSDCAQTYYIQPAGSLSISSLNNGTCGGSYTLTAPAGAKSYLWSPGGATTQSIITTSAATTYSVTAAYDFTPTGAMGGSTTYSTTTGAIVANVVTVRLQDSHGAGLAGGVVTYYNGGWHTTGPGTGVTDANGFFCSPLPAGSNSVRITYKGGSKQWDGVVASENPVLIATTAPVSVNLKDHNGNLITSESGTPSLYEGGPWVSLGSTGAAGHVNIELLTGSYSFNMNFHNHTYQPVNFPIVEGANNVDFQTTLVSINLKNCGGALLSGSATATYNGGTWSSDISMSTGHTELELLPGSYSAAMTYHNTHLQTNGNVVGGPTSSFDFTTTAVSVNNPNGSAVSYYGTSGWQPFTSPMELLPVSVIFHSNSSAPNVSIAVSGCAQTLYITPCTLLGINVANNGGCAASSTLTAPAGASYSWAPAEGLSATTGASVVASPSVTTTYTVTVGYDFTCAGTAGVPVQYTTTVTGATANVYTVRLIDSKGNGIAGAQVQYYSGGWHDFSSGNTNSGGYACMPLTSGTYSFRVMYAHGTQQWTGTVAAYNAIYTVQTTNVHVRLLNSSSQPITATDAGTGVQYYIGGWWDVDAGTTGTTGMASVELLQGSYIFHMTYAHATLQLASTPIYAGPDQNVDFTTVAVTATLTGNNGAGAGLSGGLAQYYNGGWYDIGTTDATGTTPAIELLPLAYQFRMTYAHATYQMPGSINVSTTQTVPFTTMSVKATLKANGGAGAAMSGGVAQYYSGGWYDMGATDGTGNTPVTELLPISYPFRMTYNFVTYQIPSSINVATTPTVNFTTTTVKVSLKSNGGGGIPVSSGIGQYYNGGWWYMGTTDGTGLTPSVELLPGSYPFNITYAHATYQTTANVVVGATASQNVLFATTTVTASLKANGGAGANLSGGVAQYYSGGWWDIGTTDDGGVTPAIELLPVSYPFHMTYAHATCQTTANVAVSGTNKCVPFTTSSVTISLMDHTGSGAIAGGVAQYYSGGWWDAGTTDGTGTTTTELLPGSYPFHMTYNYGTYQPANMTVSGAASSVPFQTARVVIHFQGKTGITHSGATIGYYSGGWHYFDHTTDGSGNASMEMLPVSLTYNAALATYGTTQSPSYYTDAAGSDGTLYVGSPIPGYHIIQSSLAERPGTPGTIAAAEATEFGVYPNPATDKITIKFTSVKDGYASVKITDMSGKVIIDRQITSTTGANAFDVELGNLANGIYMLMFDNGGTNEVRKINVQH